MGDEQPVQSPKRAGVLEIWIPTGGRVEETHGEIRRGDRSAVGLYQPERVAPEADRLDHVAAQSEREDRTLVRGEELWSADNGVVELGQPAIAEHEGLVA
jgi:hypothetical protein